MDLLLTLGDLRVDDNSILVQRTRKKYQKEARKLHIHSQRPITRSSLERFWDKRVPRSLRSLRKKDLFDPKMTKNRHFLTKNFNDQNFLDQYFISAKKNFDPNFSPNFFLPIIYFFTQIFFYFFGFKIFFTIHFFIQNKNIIEKKYQEWNGTLTFLKEQTAHHVIPLGLI